MFRRLASIVLIVAVAQQAIGLAAARINPIWSATSTRDARYAVRGVITGVTARRLVINCPGRPGNELALALMPATDVDGRLVVGATVSVRYVREKGMLTATAVAVHTWQPAAVPLHEVE